MSTGTDAQLLTDRQAGARLAVSRATIWRLIAAGHLHVIKIGRATRITEQSIRDYVRQRETTVDN